MKHLIIGLITTALLTGCGESFDASSDQMSRISVERIVKDLGPAEGEQFREDLSFYLKPYEDFCINADGDGFCQYENDIAALHGESDSAVVRIVKEHRENREKFTKYKEVEEMKYLIVEAKRYADFWASAMDNIDVEVLGTRAYIYEPAYEYDTEKDAYFDVKIQVINNSDVDIGSIVFDVTFATKEGKRETKEVKVAGYHGHDNVFPAGESLDREVHFGNIYIGRREPSKNDLDWIERMKSASVEYKGWYPSNSDFQQHNLKDWQDSRLLALKTTYPEDYKRLADEFDYDLP